MRTEACDILVIGSGIAGLSFALHCAENFRDKKIVVLSKGKLEESNTRYAQGGIAAVMDRLHDSYEQHIEDTLKAGDGLCDKQIVELVVKEAPRQMLKLMDWGVAFDRQGTGFSLGREGGHSANRILHCKDHTGANVGASLLEQARALNNLALRENQFVLELLTSNQGQLKRCTGALVQNGEIYSISAHYTMLASGGAGQLYELTSNPSVATGDGMALGYRIGTKLSNMAFVQFHPTVLFEDSPGQPFLISEAVRGYGGILRNDQQEDFMYRYDPRGSLATRDIVARAIFTEMQQAETPHAWLDLRHLDSNDFKRKFPTIAAKVEELNLDVSKDMLPVLPAAHYFCGGLTTNQWGQTNILGLLASGECAFTGLHGANRLASNSLLEALVFARQAYLKLKEDFQQVEKFEAPTPNISPASDFEYDSLRKKLQHIMTLKAGIVRNKKGLTEARAELEKILAELPQQDYSIAGMELRNLICVGLAVIKDSLQQPENRGGLYREDLAFQLH